MQVDLVPCGSLRTAFLHDIHKRFFVRLKRRFFVPAHIPPKAPRAAAVSTGPEGHRSESGAKRC